MKQETISKPDYVERILNFYLGLAQTPARYNRMDRRLAEDLYEKQIEIEEVEAAMMLATGRRSLRSSDAPKLGPIRSLHYFVPVIEEVRSTPISPDYIAYLRRKLAALQHTS